MNPEQHQKAVTGLTNPDARTHQHGTTAHNKRSFIEPVRIRLLPLCRLRSAEPAAEQLA
jgi:hypothetical protein